MAETILYHTPRVPPTKSEIKQVIIQRLLDIEYPPDSRFHREDPDGWDTERQMLVLRASWNTMTLEDLAKGLKDG